MPPEKAAPRLRVLIVDDDESMRLLLAAQLAKEMTVEVEFAGSCEQALHLAENDAYDTILLDLIMPGIGGFGVLYFVRRSKPNAGTPVIMISQVSEHDAIERCLAAGADDFLVKPVKSAELARAMTHQLAARSKTR